jgi:hypothetical protein
MYQLISPTFLSVSILTILCFIDYSFLIYYYSYLFINLIYTAYSLWHTPKYLDPIIPSELMTIYKKYYIYFTYPNSSIIKSRNLSYIGLSTCIVGVYMSIFFHWYIIIFSLIIFVVTSEMAPSFNPKYFVNLNIKNRYNYGSTDPLELDSILLIDELLNKKHIIK